MSKPAAAKGKTAAQEKIAAKLREERTISERLNFEGLARKDVPKDGACLFRAIAEHIYQSQAHHILVRDECLDFIEMNREAFEPFICADGVRFDHYIAEMRKPNAWGGQVELQAASIRYNVNFDIITTQANHTVVDNGFKKAISLCFTHGNHYDTVYPTRRFELEKLCQGLIYELIDKAVGLPPPAGGYTYRNVEIDVWRRGVEEQKKVDAERAQKLHEESKNLSGYYKKENEPDEGEMTLARRRRNKKKNKQVVHIPLSVVADSPKDKKQAAAAAEEKAEEVEIEVEPKIDINAQELFPTLKPKPTPSVPKTPTAAPAPASPANTPAASPAAATGGAALQPSAGGSKWGQQRNWNAVFTAPAPAAAAAAKVNSASAANTAPVQAAPTSTSPAAPVVQPTTASTPVSAPAASTDSKPAATPTRSPKTSQQGIPVGENSPANLNRSRDGAPASAASPKGSPAANGNNANSKKASRENVAAAQPKGGADARPKVVWGVPMKKSTEGNGGSTDLSLTFGTFGPSAAASPAVTSAPSVPASPSHTLSHSPVPSPAGAAHVAPGAASAASKQSPTAPAAHPPPHSPMVAPPPHGWTTLPPHAQQAAMQHAYYYGLPPFGNGPYTMAPPPQFFVQGMPGPMYAMPPPPFHPMSPPHQ